jgi:probable rRNA maturation factor
MSRLTVETEGKGSESIIKLIRLAAKSTFSHFEYDWDGYVFIQLVDGETIRAINNEHRGIDRETDVLSFPMGENGEFDTNLDTGAKVLGDIIISIEHAYDQAEKYGHTLQREIGFLTVHSLLHLLGYDHEDGGLEMVKMREKEETVLTSIGLKRNGSYYFDGE